RVELHQRERTVFGDMRLEQRIGREVIAAEREQSRSRRQYLFRLGLYLRGRLVVVAVIQYAVADIDRGELFVKIEAKRILRIALEDRGGRADRARAEARARPVRGGGVERHAPDREIGALRVFRVAPPHEGQRAAIGRLVHAAAHILALEGVVGGTR